MRASLRSAERGSALPLVAALMVLFGCIVVVIARQAVPATDRARAQTAADAAALAGAAEGRAAAQRLAEANGAELIAYLELGGGDADVTVRLGSAEASARARVDPLPADPDEPDDPDPDPDPGSDDPVDPVDPCERSGDAAFGAHRKPRWWSGGLAGGVRLAVGVGGGDLESVVFAEAP